MLWSESCKDSVTRYYREIHRGRMDQVTEMAAEQAQAENDYLSDMEC
jgi:hypothetical protein